MVVNKRSKRSRQRASTTHGYGSKKKHRGHGSRGGSGLGGTGKRADSKKPSFWQEPYFGKYGFNRNVTVKPVIPINIIEIEKNIEKYVKEKLATKENDHYLIDLINIGKNKLLGTGKATRKYKITTKFASSKAVGKIQEAGGQVTITIKKKEKSVKPTEDKKR